MKLLSPFAFVLFLISTTAQEWCGPTAATLNIRGSSIAFNLVKAWSIAYQKCPGIGFSLGAGKSDYGAEYVCTNDDADIGTMSRDWTEQEATTTNNWKYDCTIGVSGNHSVIQIDVATVGIVVVAKKGGSANDCIDALGGLTIHQLRWIYSSYTEAELTSTGWDPSSVPNSDHDDGTHFWNELLADVSCPATEIKISGADGSSDSHDFFRTVVLTDKMHGETFATSRAYAYNTNTTEYDLVRFLVKEEIDLSFLGFDVYHGNSSQYLYAAAIQNNQSRLVAPSLDTIADGSYSPLSRRIYMNLYDSEASLRNTIPFINFILSDKGSRIASSNGFFPILDYEKKIMLARLGLVNLTDIQCNQDDNGGVITMAGSVQPVAKFWAGMYSAACDVRITMDGGGSSVGAGRVCANPTYGDAVTIGDMSRQWQDDEAATPSNGYIFHCVSPGDVNRSVIQIDIAIDVLAIVVKAGGEAAACIQALGGLTIDQLRWIYSNYTLAELAMSVGWNSSTVPNSDGNDTTHLWSELKNTSACPQSEIQISGADSSSGAYEFFVQTVLTDFNEGETVRFDDYLGSPNNIDLKDYVNSTTDAISYIGYPTFLRNTGSLTAAAIKNAAGVHVKPTPVTVEDGTYNPFSTRIFMNLLNDEIALKPIRPFLTFAMSDTGTSLVESIGYSAIPSYERAVMLSRAKAVGGIDIETVICGPPGEKIKIAGSSAVFPIAQIWAGIYEIACDVSFVIEGGGSSVGAGRVCNNSAFQSSVDIGDMSRQWSTEEGSTINGHVFNCKSPGDTSRVTIQIEVAIDGLSVATQTGGNAYNCITALGGLTTDQLRWMYSSYNETMLATTGWSSAAVPNSDGNPDTYLWSELLDSPSCSETEIKIAGVDIASGMHDYFLRTILLDYENGEVFDTSRPGGYKPGDAADETLVYYLHQYEDAIAYFGYAYYYSNQDMISAVAIRNDRGQFIFPSQDTVENGSYNPLSRRIYMNLASSSLNNTRPFIEFGLNNDDLVFTTGYVPIPIVDKNEMFSRLAGAGPVTAPTTGNGVVLDDGSVSLSPTEAPVDVSVSLSPTEAPIVTSSQKEPKKSGAIVGGFICGIFVAGLLIVWRRRAIFDETFESYHRDNDLLLTEETLV